MLVVYDLGEAGIVSFSDISLTSEIGREDGRTPRLDGHSGHLGFSDIHWHFSVLFFVLTCVQEASRGLYFGMDGAYGGVSTTGIVVVGTYFVPVL